jgi:hypothetical protein
MPGSGRGSPDISTDSELHVAKVKFEQQPARRPRSAGAFPCRARPAEGYAALRKDRPS